VLPGSLFDMEMITAAELNDAIRAVVLAGRAGSAGYEELLARWVAAMRAEQELAA
jgi:ABC-type transporter Mla maintaining outer membrane lipid asymmetry permease subunit MlaE